MPISGGTAQQLIIEPVGAYNITALYGGDPTFAATLQSAETPATLTVEPVATTTTLSPGSTSVIAPESATFTATVTSPAGTPPDGTVQFLVSGVDDQAAVPLSNGTAQLIITEPVGSYTVTAKYSGDPNFSPSPASAASALTVTKSSLLPTTTSVTPGVATIDSGQEETFTATVSAGSSSASDGFVQFAVDGTDYGAAVPVSGGSAQETIAEPTGTYTVTAQYLGDQTYFAASPVSADANLSVLPGYSPTQLNPTQAAALLNGLEFLATWANSFDQDGILAQTLPIVDESLGTALDFGGILQAALVSPLQVLSSNSGLTSSSAVVGAFKNDSMVGLVNGGEITAPQGQEIAFSLEIDTGHISDTGFDLGANAAQDGLSVSPGPNSTITEPQVQLNTVVNLELTFGINASNNFFIQFGNLTITTSPTLFNNESTGIVGFYGQIGLLSLAMTNTTFGLEADVSATVNDPSQNATNQISLAALEDDSVSSLVNLVPTAQSLSLPLAVQARLSNWVTTGSPTITLSSSNVFDGTARPSRSTAMPRYCSISHGCPPTASRRSSARSARPCKTSARPSTSPAAPTCRSSPISSASW